MNGFGTLEIVCPTPSWVLLGVLLFWLPHIYGAFFFDKIYGALYCFFLVVYFK